MLPGWDSVEAAASYARLFTYAGWIALFALGIAEIVGHVYSVRETTLREAAAARDTENRRAEADARIAEAHRKSVEASEGTAKALVNAAEANERAKKNELETAAQQERAAKAEKDLLELQRRTEPRSIGRVDGTKLIDVLKRATPKGVVDLQCVMGDGEGAAFANQIDQVLKAGGWTTTGVSQGIYSGGNPIGWGIVIHQLSSPSPAATALRNAFVSAGFPLQFAENTGLTAGQIQMLIGNKQ